MQELLRKLPKVDEVLKRPAIGVLAQPRWAVVEAVRRAVQQRREAIVRGESEDASVDDDQVARLAQALAQPSLRRVINATGVVLHTNLGRAPLAAEVAARVTELSVGYSNLEYELQGRGRGSRHDHLRELLIQLTGAEDAAVVNNNASAVMLGLAALAAGREVVVSRGELVEIGGSFRIPDVMRLSGARLVEVGTTNKTHRRDYEAAVGDDTGLLLKVHQSNFQMVGFTAEVSLADMVAVGRQRGVASMIDLGSGVMLEASELAEAGLPPEPSVRATVSSGVDLATFSGDKLLGGPQAGILVGSREAVEAARRHPLMRALRPDKLALGALEATLAMYRDGRAGAIPAVAMLTATPEALRARAQALLAQIGAAPPGVTVELTECESAVGGGAWPTAVLPSWAVALAPRVATGRSSALAAMDERLRGVVAGGLPVVGRIAGDRLLLDLRTVASEELPAVAAAVRAL